MIFAAIDPGSSHSGMVCIDAVGRVLAYAEYLENSQVTLDGMEDIRSLVIEGLQSHGNVMGQTILDTALWTGRFIERMNKAVPVYILPRMEVRKQVQATLGTRYAGDAEVRIYLETRFGGERFKKVNAHCLQAYALGTVFMDIAPSLREVYRVK